MKITTKTLFKSGYANNSSTIIQFIMICVFEAQYMLYDPTPKFNNNTY